MLTTSVLKARERRFTNLKKVALWSSKFAFIYAFSHCSQRITCAASILRFCDRDMKLSTQNRLERALRTQARLNSNFETHLISTAVQISRRSLLLTRPLHAFIIMIYIWASNFHPPSFLYLSSILKISALASLSAAFSLATQRLLSTFTMAKRVCIIGTSLTPPSSPQSQSCSSPSQI